MKRIGRILLCILMITVLFGISIMGNFVVKSENKSKEKKKENCYHEKRNEGVGCTGRRDAEIL